MGEGDWSFVDYHNDLRNGAIEEMEEILDELKSIGEEYKIDSERLDIIKEMVIDRGDTLRSQSESLGDLTSKLIDQLNEIEQLKEEIRLSKQL